MKKPKLFSDLDRLGREAFLEAVQKPRIVTCPQGVVTYTMAQEGSRRIGSVLEQLLGPEEIEKKIREILAVAPGITLAKLRKLGQDMGITIRAFEKAQPAAPPPDEDVIF